MAAISYSTMFMSMNHVHKKFQIVVLYATNIAKNSPSSLLKGV